MEKPGWNPNWQSDRILLAEMKSDRYSKRWRSRTLLIEESREMGRKSEGEEDGRDVLGIGVTRNSFHPEGRVPVVNEELKIIERGTEMEAAVFLSIKDEIESGLREVSKGIRVRR